MALFFATFEDVVVSAAQDVFELVAPTGIRLALHEVLIGQHSDFGDAHAELLSIKLIRGHTTAGLGGSTPTIHTRSNHASATASSSTVLANNTTVASGGTAQTLISDTFNVAAGFVHRPRFFEHSNYDERILLQPGDRLAIRIEAPNDSLTCNGTIVFEEVGIDASKGF